MKYIITAIVIFASFSTAAQAAVCTDFPASIDRSLKYIAALEGTISLSSREGLTLEQLDTRTAIGNEWQRINIIIQLMAQNKCPPLADATNYSRFSK